MPNALGEGDVMTGTQLTLEDLAGGIFAMGCVAGLFMLAAIGFLLWMHLKKVGEMHQVTCKFLAELIAKKEKD